MATTFGALLHTEVAALSRVHDALHDAGHGAINDAVNDAAHIHGWRRT